MVHLQENGFSVQDAPTSSRQELAAIRERAGVPRDSASCHTAFVGPYVIEGHVPADVIKDLLKKAPTDVRGLVVPRMPAGSPGMASKHPVPYTIFALKDDGSMEEFARR